MWKWLILILLATYSVNAETFTMKKKKQFPKELLISFLKDFSEFAERPMNWCSVSAMQNYEVREVYRDTTTLILGFDVKCDATQHSKKFLALLEKHRFYIDNCAETVDSAITANFPDIEFY